MTVISISGIRGILNEDLMPADVVRYAGGFAALAPSSEYLIGRDTRSTGDVIRRLFDCVLLGTGADVIDYGVISTPALFRESRKRERPAVMITASHNEPEWNGIKFILNGRGIVQSELERLLERRRAPSSPSSAPRSVESGSLRRGPTPSYDAELIEMGGEGSCEGVKVVVDMNGGAAIRHAPAIFQGLGCDVATIGGTAGIFSRAIDPTNDDLDMLSKTVKDKGAAVGFAFDCDGDRLVVVDDKGERKTGDYMLTLAIKELLPGLANRSVVVSMDTTQAIDEVVSKLAGRVYRSKVGEANVISKMMEEGASIGGEGSSGGLVQGDFNFCRDSMVAAVTIARALKSRGTRIFGRVQSYSQVRVKLAMEKRRALAAIKGLQKQHPGADTLDGLKLYTSAHSWVLIRASGTEDIVRVSAEAPSAEEAQRLADSFLDQLKRLGA